MPTKAPTLREQNANLQAKVEHLAENLDQVRAMFKREDANWRLLSGVDDEDGLGLDELKEWSTQIRNSVYGNPHIGRGKRLRTSYIWQAGIKYHGIPVAKQGVAKAKVVQTFIDHPLNQRNFFGGPARARREGCLYSDGIYLVFGDDTTKKLENIPLTEITADYRDPNRAADIWAYRHTWMSFDDPNSPNGEEKSEWVFTDTFADRRRKTIKFGGKFELVSQTKTAFDQHANGLDGFAYGAPDALAALMWSRIVRDLTMDGVSMSAAMATIAFQASSATAEGGRNVSLKMGGGAPAGSTAVVVGADKLTPLASAGRGYDFSSFRDVVAVVATSLDLSVEDLVSDSEAGSNKASSLPLPTRLAVEARRAEHVLFDRRVLTWMGAPDAEVFFADLMDPADKYRAQQGIGIKWGTGLYTPEEIKTEMEALEGNDVVKITVPDGVLLPNNEKSLPRKDIDLDSKGDGSAANGGGFAPTQGSGADFTGGGSGDQNANDINANRASGK